MENQIIRIPYKYGELIKTMTDEDSGKLMKALFFKDSSKIDGLPLTYYNIIMVDIENLENMVRKGQEGGKKGGRPSKNKPPLKTPPINPPFSQEETQDKIKQDKIKEDNTSIVETEKIIEGEIIEEKELSIINEDGNIFKTIDNKDILKKYEITESELEEEIERFISYWTEPFLKGKKQGQPKWTGEETFEPNRRLAYWLGNNKKWNKRVLLTKNKGIGVVE